MGLIDAAHQKAYYESQVKQEPEVKREYQQQL